MTYFVTKADRKPWRIMQIRLSGNSPEKAGVGGSIPSLATIYNQ